MRRLAAAAILIPVLAGAGCSSSKVFDSLQKGRVRIMSSPPGAAIEFDGTPRGATQAKGPLLIRSVVYGWHTIRATFPGRVPHVEDVELRAEDILVRIPLDDTKFGRLVVITNPPGAEVFIDSRYYGVTKERLVLDDLPFGSHSLWVRLKGYRDERRRIVIERQQERAYRIHLEKK